MDKQQMIELASDFDSTAEQLAQLVNKCIDVNRLLAKHPRTPSKILDDICQFSQYDAESMRNVIRNPNVPIDALIFFGHEYPSDLMRNPALNLFLIERPGLFYEIPELLEISDCPIDFIRSIVNKGIRSSLKRSCTSGVDRIPAVENVLDDSVPMSVDGRLGE